MKNKQISLFRDLSFCWEHFEQDGLTDAIILRFMSSIVSPVLVVGSGQGLVSRALLDAGHQVHSIDCLEIMAQLAVQRNSVETTVIDFLYLNATNEYKTVIINTGVLYPIFIKRHLNDFVDKINEVLRCGGMILLSFLRKTDFDITVLDLKLHKDKKLLVEIWRGLNSGRNIFEVLLNEFRDLPGIRYLLCQHKQELAEFESQIRIAGRKFESSNSCKKTEEFIAESLSYVSFGIERDDQISLFHSFDRLSIRLKEVDNVKNATFAILEKAIDRE